MSLGVVFFCWSGVLLFILFAIVRCFVAVLLLLPAAACVGVAVDVGVGIVPHPAAGGAEGELSAEPHVPVGGSKDEHRCARPLQGARELRALLPWPAGERETAIASETRDKRQERDTDGLLFSCVKSSSFFRGRGASYTGGGC